LDSITAGSAPRIRRETTFAPESDLLDRSGDHLGCWHCALSSSSKDFLTTNGHEWTPMTDAQKDAIKKITDLMREHFDQGIASLVCEDSDDERDQEVHVTWHGSFASAYGLLELGKLQMISEREQNYGRE
jgi:hypothetical protein